MHLAEAVQSRNVDETEVHSTVRRTPTISLVLPAYNEAAVIADAVFEANAALSQITDVYEIIVVDDGSVDETSAIVNELASANEHVQLIRHSPNRGYGAAIRSGFAAAKHELVVFTDADCQFDLTELDRFVLLSNRYDIVCGYRIDRKDTPLRCLYSKVYNLLVRALLGTGVRDVDCALKMLHHDVAKNLRITGNGFLVNSEMLTQARQSSLSVVEVGVSHRPRLQGESTVSVTHIPKVLTSLLRYWWNEVQFPNSQPNRQPVTQPTEPRSLLGVAHDRWWQFGLVLIAAVFMLTNLSYPLIDRDETRYAEIPREMIATGNWILPQLNFTTYYDKPPMLYWLCAISFKVFGIGESSARLVPALAALFTLVSTIYFGSRIFDRRIGLLAGIILLLSVGFAFTSRYLLLDGLLSLFVSLSLFAAYEALRVPSRVEKTRGHRDVHWGWWIASGVCIGIAFLTKGPIAVVLWLPPVLAMTWLSDTTAKPRWWHYGILGSVAVVIAAPWFVLVHLQDQSFLFNFFYKHNIARFAGEFHARPFWYFVPVLLLAGHPWSFLTIPYAKFLFGRDDASRSRRTPATGFLLLWSGWCFLFFSISSCKLPTYILPAAPALALMLGHYLNEVLRDTTNSPQYFFARFWSARTATAATCFTGVAFVLFVMQTTGEATAALFGWAMLWATLLMTSLLLMADRYHASIAWGTSTGVAALLAVMTMHQMVPAYSRSQTVVGDTSPLAEQLTADTRLQIATINHEFSEIPFYLDRNDIRNFADVEDPKLGEFVAKSGSAILIVDDRIAPQDVLRQLPERSKLIEVGHRGSALMYHATRVTGSTRIAMVPDASKGSHQ